MKFTRNYNGIPEQEDYQLLPEGNYMFEIYEVSEGYSSNNDPMPSITLRCIEEGEFEGLKVWDNILIPEPDSPAGKIIGRTKRFLHAIGEPYEGGDFDVDTDNWINKTVEAKIGIKDYNGKKNFVQRYLLSENKQNINNNKSHSSNNSSEKNKNTKLPWENTTSKPLKGYIPDSNNNSDDDLPF